MTPEKIAEKLYEAYYEKDGWGDRLPKFKDVSDDTKARWKAVAEKAIVELGVGEGQ